MKATISRSPRALLTVTLGGKTNQELIRRVDAAARRVDRSRANMLLVIAEDWLAAWEASGCHEAPLIGCRLPFQGKQGGGSIAVFRPRLVSAPPVGGAA